MIFQPNPYFHHVLRIPELGDISNLYNVHIFRMDPNHRIPMKLSAMMMMVSAKFPIDITRLYGKVNVFARSPLNPNLSG